MSDEEVLWREDELVPVTPGEQARLLRETLAHAREQGWIPVDDLGCECLTCRLWRAFEL